MFIWLGAVPPGNELHCGSLVAKRVAIPHQPVLWLQHLKLHLTVNLRAHSIMRNRFQIDPDIPETGFRYSGFLHSIGETETGFAKPSKPGREMVSLTKPKMAHVFMLNYLLSSSPKLRLKVTYTYSTWSILKYFDRYIGNYERGTF